MQSLKEKELRPQWQDESRLARILARSTCESITQAERSSYLNIRFSQEDLEALSRLAKRIEK